MWQRSNGAATVALSRRGVVYMIYRNQWSTLPLDLQGNVGVVSRLSDWTWTASNTVARRKRRIRRIKRETKEKKRRRIAGCERMGENTASWRAGRAKKAGGKDAPKKKIKEKGGWGRYEKIEWPGDTWEILGERGGALGAPSILSRIRAQRRAETCVGAIRVSESGWLRRTVRQSCMQIGSVISKFVLPPTHRRCKLLTDKLFVRDGGIWLKNKRE